MYIYLLASVNKLTYYKTVVTIQRMKGFFMSDFNDDNNFDKELDEEMTVSLDLDDGTTVVCSIVTIFEMNDKDYIALMPLDEEGNADSDEVWIYGYKENEKDPNEEPELIYIEDEEEYEAAADKFDEYLDSLDFEDQ